LAAPGQVFSVNKFFNALKSKGVPCTKNALYDYLEHLGDAHFLHRLPFHSQSVRVRQVNPEKVYANDTALHGLFLSGEGRGIGALLETAVFLHLRRSRLSLSYLHTKDGHEIDFVATDEASGRTRLIQVCADLSSPETLAREVRPFAALPPDVAEAEKLIVTLGETRDLGNGIRALPAWQFLLENV
jgi:predicted AAA+ superfamily ATPase